MPKLPPTNGDEAVRKFKKLGYTVTRQRGSHVRMESPDPARRKITVPQHNPVKKGLLRQIIKDANLSVEEFIAL